MNLPQTTTEAPLSRVEKSETLAVAKLDPMWTELSLGDRYHLCAQMVRSGLIPFKHPDEAYAVHLYGYELGIKPMQAFRQIHFFRGKNGVARMGVESSLMLTLANKHANVTWKWGECDRDKAQIELFRPDFPDQGMIEYTMEEAKTAGLTGKDNWRQNPRAMLQARVSARAVRMVVPDYFGGVYTPEEMTSSGLQAIDEESQGPSEATAALNAQLDEVEVPEPEDIEPLEEPWRKAAREEAIVIHPGGAGELAGILTQIETSDQSHVSILMEGLRAKVAAEAEEAAEDEEQPEEDAAQEGEPSEDSEAEG